MSTLETRRLALRPWLARDREPFAALHADPEVMAHFPSPLGREESDTLADRMEAEHAHRSIGFWVVEELATGRFLGVAGLSVPSWEAPFLPGVEVGWRFARHAWGQGFATEAGRASLAFGFAMGIERILAFTARTNLASQRVMQRLGMTRLADFDHPRIAAGHALRPHVLYAIARHPRRPT